MEKGLEAVESDDMTKDINWFLQELDAFVTYHAQIQQSCLILRFALAKSEFFLDSRRGMGFANGSHLITDKTDAQNFQDDLAAAFRRQMNTAYDSFPPMVKKMKSDYAAQMTPANHWWRFQEVRTSEQI